MRSFFVFCVLVVTALAYLVQAGPVILNSGTIKSDLFANPRSVFYIVKLTLTENFESESKDSALFVKFYAP